MFTNVLEESAASIFRRQHVSLKHWQISIRLLGVMSQKLITFTVTATEISNLIIGMIQAWIRYFSAPDYTKFYIETNMCGFLRVINTN
jgi:hypothetical protein